MCTTVNRYQSKIDTLKNKIYPSVSDLLSEVSCYRNVFDYDNLEPSINTLSNEFSSLCSVEEKLIFPAIISVFNTNNGNPDFFPNVQEIVQLTLSKEQKIYKSLLDIQAIVNVDNNHYSNDFEKQVLQLIHIFNEAYFPCKKQWIALLQMLTPQKVQCNNRDGDACKCGHKADKENHQHHIDSNSQMSV